MTRIRLLFLVLTIIGPLHMIEQIATDIEEFYMMRGLVDRWYTLFDPAVADHATVGLVTIIWTVVSVLFWLVLKEGVPRMVVLGVFGVFGVTELHHVVEAIGKGGYDAGVITCVPYAIAGGALVAAVWRELRGPRLIEHGARSLA